MIRFGLGRNGTLVIPGLREACRAALLAGIRAAWRQKRVCTDGDMSALLDAWMQDDMRPAFEIADRSNGRITVETHEQLRSGLIAAVWAVEPNVPGRATPMAFGEDGIYRPAKRYLASGPAHYNAAVHDEIQIDVPDMVVDFEGSAQLVTLHGARGEEVFSLAFDARHVRAGDTLCVLDRAAGDRIDVTVSPSGRPMGRIHRARTVRTVDT